MSYSIGEKVYILAKRMEGGCSHVGYAHPEAPSFPIEECKVAQVDVCRLKGYYGLVWADTGEPVGLSFNEKNMARSPEELRELVDKCQVPL